jgi:hypothetical protein
MERCLITQLFSFLLILLFLFQHQSFCEGKISELKSKKFYGSCISNMMPCVSLGIYSELVKYNQTVMVLPCSLLLYEKDKRYAHVPHLPYWEQMKFFFLIQKWRFLLCHLHEYFKNFSLIPPLLIFSLVLKGLPSRKVHRKNTLFFIFSKASWQDFPFS